eukprot:TRINITY_DN22653_c0_g1_i1.p1 TRINITY_DN22653_c0_g1~~TRINITY_DN22653_c0_g1_i1.p1  ORF type:complete len:261 (-),score=18.77 TRINITY_DN22653_c0_g1_i1:64-846(-)
MAVGKNKRLSKGKKGTKKKVVDPFTRKDWFDVKAPSYYNVSDVCKTLVNRTQGTRTAEDGLRGRIFEVCLADLQKDEEHGFRKIKLKVEDVRGKDCLTQFYGMDMTSDKLKSLIKKWQSLIEAHIDVKTTDGYTLRVFVIAFTKKQMKQQKKTCYATSSQVRRIRKRMFEVVTKEVTTCDLKQLVAKFNASSIGESIVKATRFTFPLQSVYVRKVKVVRTPKFDVNKLLELYRGHGGKVPGDGGRGIGRNWEEPEVLEEV